ncbi:MAG: hypothetical protein ACI8W3_003653 [Myxococcota bacterium]|jgi:hypothetical protein
MTDNCLKRIAKRASVMLTLFCFFGFSTAANALNIDFEYLDHGEIAFGTIDGVTISAFNFNRDFNYAVGFDSNATGTSDEDLESAGLPTPWSGGNIAGEDLGTMLILQENSDGCDTGICSDPDDEGMRRAGVFVFDFATPITAFGFDGIDIESLTAENMTIDFAFGDDFVTVDLMDFFDPSSILYDPTLSLGNNTANRFTAITAESLGFDQIDRVKIIMGGSGGIDNLNYTPVPEPTTALLMALGLSGLAVKRRHSIGARA